MKKTTRITPATVAAWTSLRTGDVLYALRLIRAGRVAASIIAMTVERELRKRELSVTQIGWR